MPRPRSVLVLFATLALVFAVVQVVPHGAREPGALQPQARRGDPLADATAGAGALSPAARAEIDRVLRRAAVSARRAVGRAGAPVSTQRLVEAAVQCAVFEGQRYCLGSGWTDATEQQVQSRTMAVAERRQTTGPVERTGDLSLSAELAQRARMSTRARARADRAELEAAARSVAKVWLLRHQVQGVALPAGFLAAHPEVSAATARPSTTARTLTVKDKARKQRAVASCTRKQTAQGAERAKAVKRCRRAYRQANPPPTTPPTIPPVLPPTTPTPEPTPTSAPVTTPAVAPSAIVPTAPITTAAVPLPTETAAPAVPVASTSGEKTYDQYPPIASILDKTQVTEQTRNYWCGPTAMQMIGWGSAGVAQSQDYWAGKLGTTRSGTGIRSMVRVVNTYTGWGGTDHGGPYVALDISSFTYDQWMLLMMKHVVDYRSPIVLHPVLLKKYYPYLDDNGSGHFQVGRGYDKKGDKADLLGYFEPWNQQRFDRSEPAISRVQWRNAYKSYRANQDHFQHNVGV